jgi:hypothetical protein
MTAEAPSCDNNRESLREQLNNLAAVIQVLSIQHIDLSAAS